MEQKAKKRQFIWARKAIPTHKQTNKKTGLANKKGSLTPLLFWQTSSDRSFKQIRASEIKYISHIFLIYIALVLFSTVAKSERTTPRSLLPRCLQWNRVKLVWRQLQLPFDHASLSHFKYTLTCAHPLMGRGGHKNISHFWVFTSLCAHTQMRRSLHTQTLYILYA